MGFWAICLLVMVINAIPYIFKVRRWDASCSALSANFQVVGHGPLGPLLLEILSGLEDGPILVLYTTDEGGNSAHLIAYAAWPRIAAKRAWPDTQPSLPDDVDQFVGTFVVGSQKQRTGAYPVARGLVWIPRQ